MVKYKVKLAKKKVIELIYNPKVQFIPARPPQRETRVGIYSRVSSNSMDQLNSLTSQISALTRMVASVPGWLLVDVYIDIASSKTGLSRKKFNRMLEDCKSKNLAKNKNVCMEILEES